ncbi:MAG: hypothetical protein ACRD2U_02785 [Terriglobales bacterium]
MRLLMIALLILPVLLSQGASAQQKNEIAVTFGRTFVGHQTVPGTNFMGNSVAFGGGLSVEADYSRRLKSSDLASLAVEVPVLLDLDEDLNYGVNVIPADYRSYFVTPSARVTLFPNIPVTPWFSVGGGFGHFSPGSTLEFGGPNPGKGNATGIFQFGGGADVTLWRSFSLRGEVRDFFSGVPQLDVNTGKNHQNNLYIGVGVVWHFGK